MVNKLQMLNSFLVSTVKNYHTVVKIGNNKTPKNHLNSKHNYTKVIIEDPYNNRDIIARVAKKQKPRPEAGGASPGVPSPNRLNPSWVTGFSDGSEKKALVVFGTNLQSTVGEKFTRKELAMVKLAPHQKSVIVGLILSDGWLSSDRKNSRLGFKQSLARFEYVWFVFNILSHYCSSSPRLTSGIRAGKRFFGLQIMTRLMPCMTELQSLFYINGVKIIHRLRMITFLSYWLLCV